MRKTLLYQRKTKKTSKEMLQEKSPVGRNEKEDILRTLSKPMDRTRKKSTIGTKLTNNNKPKSSDRQGRE